MFPRTRRHCLAVLALALALALAPAWAFAARPPALVPDNPGVVLERLPRGYAALMPTAARIAPMALIQKLLTTAASSGDARLAARAESLLSTVPAGLADTAEVAKARAFAAQHRHDFTTALRLLDGVIAANPRDGGARLSRAQILLVQGQIARARSDCAALALGIDAGSGQLCIAALSLRMGRYASATAMVDRLLAPPASDPGLGRYLLVMRGEIASRAGDADADRWFEQALAAAPDDVRTLAAYARHLRSRGEQRRIVRLLGNGPDTDGLRLQLALAVGAAGLPQAALLAAAQGRRYATAHDVGSEPELRDEAEYLLTLRGDASGALTLAQRNFQTQRDYEDVDILRRSALAAGREDVVAALDAWLQSQGLAASAAPQGRQ